MFYMNMLREQDELMGNPGFDPNMVVNSDDKYAIDLKDVAKAVEDINDEYADESEQEELDGQDLHEDPVSECMIAIYESEHNWNAIMQAIGTHELMESARGREMVMEAVDIKSYIDKAKEFFVNQFKKITDIVKEWMRKHSVVARANKAFVAKYGSKFEEGRAAYEKSDRKALTGYNFATSKVSDLLNSEKAIIGFVSDMAKSANMDDFKQESLGHIAPDVIRGRMVGSASQAADGYSAALKKKYFGEKGTLTAETLGKVKGVLSDGVRNINDAKDVYAEIKRSYNEILKALNALKSGVDKSEKKGEAMGNLTKYIAAVKEAKNITHMGFTTMLSAMRAEQLQAMRVAHAWVSSIEKPKKEKKAEKETTKTESAGFFGALELL